jgi:hypothetical protein
VFWKSDFPTKPPGFRVKLTEGPTTWANFRREWKIVHVVYKHLYKSMYLAYTFIYTIKGLVAWCHSFCLFGYFIVHTFIPSHSYCTFIRHHSPKFLSIFSSLVSSVGKTSLGCRAEIQTGACLTASRLTTNWATPHPLSAVPHPYWAKLRPYWTTPHPCWATPQLFGTSTLHYLISQTPSFCFNAA